MKDLNIVIPITKADESRHEIYGIMTAEEVDKSGECLDYEGAKPEIQKWSDEISRISKGKSKGNLRRQHNANDVVGKVIDIVFNDTAKQVECCAKVTDERTFSDILSGVISGFSIGGSYLKTWVDENGVTKYIPRITELSVVDSPCVGNATIQFIKADGTTETKTFTKKEDKPMEDLTKVNDEVMAGFKEALAKADTKKAFSFEEITNRIEGALGAQITTPFNCGYFYIVDTFADSVIIRGDLDGDGYQDCYRVGYTMDGDGVITLGKIEAVRHTWVPAIDEDNPNQEFGLPKAHKADEATDLQKADDPQEEAAEETPVEKMTKADDSKKEDEDKEDDKDSEDESEDKEEIEKRDFSAEERKKLAEEGKAMPDGSFPIENKEDLKNAIRLVGQAKDKEKAMAFIRRRAKALDAEDMIPDTWGKAEKADEAEEMTKADCQKEDIFEAVCKAMDKADDSIKEKCGKLFHKMVEKGLYCSCDKCTKAVEGEKAEKATADTDLNKAASVGEKLATVSISTDELAKAMGVIDELKKAFDGLKSDNDELRKQVEKLENEPVAGGAMVATGTMALDKTIGGSVGNPPTNNSEEAMLRKMIDNADSPILKEAYSKQLAQLEMKKVFG